MAQVDVSRCVASLLVDVETLSLLSTTTPIPSRTLTSQPSSYRDVLTDAKSPVILQVTALASLANPCLTDRLYVHFVDVWPDICARWLSLIVDGDNSQFLSLGTVVGAFARILPFAPHVSVLLERALLDSDRTPLFHSSPPVSPPGPSQPSILQLTTRPQELVEVLLAAWRLNSFSQRTYGSLFTPSFLQSLFKHESRQVRYLAIRVFCQLLRAADQTMEKLIAEHVGEADSEAIAGDFDGTEIDFSFLTIHERARVDALAKRISERDALFVPLAQPVFEGLKESKSTSAIIIPSVIPQTLSEQVVSYGLAMLPRPLGPPKTSESILIPTPTTLSNLENFARILQQPGAILLHGLPGTGKTALVRELATQLGQLDQMVTVHLNEQTDAKMLIGLYTTDSKPGSFTWRPGILTTAVHQGRWVLIEDLDRAPAEVISTILPLIERGELLIPSRGEKIIASNGFRLFATVRTTKGMHGREILPHLLGLRFWQQLAVQQLSEDELRAVIGGLFPILQNLITIILGVYNNLTQLASSVAVESSSHGMLRQISLRDLLKWCRRLSSVLASAGCMTGSESISESVRNNMFQEAIDCFLGHLPDVSARNELIYAIGRKMHMSRETVEHYLTAYIPPLTTPGDSGNQLHVGRAVLERKKNATTSLSGKPKRPFANTVHTKRLLEQIATSVRLREPVLLVGETGIGKTSVVQQMADVLGHKLVAVNLSQQSEVGDLLGGFKPVTTRSLAVPLKEEFENLLIVTGISRTRNVAYLDKVNRCFAKGQWGRMLDLLSEAPTMFAQILAKYKEKAAAVMAEPSDDTEEKPDQPNKRRRIASSLNNLTELQPRWQDFSKALGQFRAQIAAGPGAFAFSFVEGNVIKAVRNGDWILLDEINLASADTLESIADLLVDSGETPSILLSETGEIERIQAHPNFRVFAAMNPATDVGKRDLPIGIRSRFTELYVNSLDTSHKDLLEIVKSYLRPGSVKDEQAADDITRLYLVTKQLASEKRLVDGANEVPHFSLRTLTRVLDYVIHVAPVYGLRRAIFEGFSMGFLTLLNGESEKLLIPKMYELLFSRASVSAKALLSQPPKQPEDGRAYIRFSNKAKDRHYWIVQGAAAKPRQREDYIVTPSVERNLLNLVRATSTRRYPILIQGPTSAGKTSMIEYLAAYSGNKFIRINNHEHTDLQEYLGTYISDTDGKLRFQEGLLVQAMRHGYWIVLDELNLAPTDVLEALNRLLDDNRELLIPETQEIVRPHEHFMLFATQNPAGLYGGRKVLSRAFRNRFLELHFDDIPETELESILQRRSKNTSPSDCKRIVNVYRELSRLRQTSRLFEQKDSFATLRDLFRWALRAADTREEIARNGFMLLAERVRDAAERDAVRVVIEKEFRVKIDPIALYAPSAVPGGVAVGGKENAQGVVWTQAMRRLYVLVATALKNNEPVLLVGDTGCGKTTVVQLLAEAVSKELHIVNAHQNTETGDLIGSQRPVRNRQAALDALATDVSAVLFTLEVTSTFDSLEDKLTAYNAIDAELLASQIPQHVRERIAANIVRSKALFEWSDGSLVHAMKTGQFFLLDEISLADDSVLERLNSVLESARTLLLAEKGVDNSFVVGADGFQFFATMNPGGDFGKKELSPALRNRFTEIWVPPLSTEADILQIVESKLREELRHLAPVIVAFSSWFANTFRATNAAGFSIREVLVWVQFMNKVITSGISQDPAFGLVHGAATVFIDSLGANPSAMVSLNPATVGEQRVACLNKISEFVGCDISNLYDLRPELTATKSALTISSFSVPRLRGASDSTGFTFHAPTTRLNTMRVVRALNMQKPILLEGSPGVGKTTLVAALAKACGQPLTRINLSDQTDLMDLFGTDAPIEGAKAGNFAWRDAPFLQAMQKGEWVLLDEMNLASQSVLEGLNACLDHRGEVYISELDQVFKCHPNFRLFAAQNPHHQGGGRKGLPSSFVNRFIVVYADSFTSEDLQLIAQHSFPMVPEDTISKLISFIALIERRVVQDRAFASLGGPWEFNLRDTLRWLHLLSSQEPLLRASPGDAGAFFDLLIAGRFRTEADRSAARALFASIFGSKPSQPNYYHDISPTYAQVGRGLIVRDAIRQPIPLCNFTMTPQLAALEALLVAVQQAQPTILSGPSGSGKSALLSHLAALAGKELVTFSLNADIDTMDLVGGFEQHDPLREVNAALKELRTTLQTTVLSVAPAPAPLDALVLLTQLEQFAESGGPRDEDVDILRGTISALSAQTSFDSIVGKQLAHVAKLLSQPLSVANPRFEWLDGVIIRALKAGLWLVLDNANLCSASVLDRLNSLLEPDGFVSINEHCGPDGEPYIVRPAPGFRIFLTMDPRYGELSRAMRNRAIEIHLIHPLNDSQVMPRYLRRVSAVESSLYRFQTVVSLAKKDYLEMEAVKSLTGLAANGLAMADISLLERFVVSARNGVLSAEQLEALQAFGQSLHGDGELWTQVEKMYSSVNSVILPSIVSAQPIQTLRNSPLVPLISALSTAATTGSALPHWLAVWYEYHTVLLYFNSAIATQTATASPARLSSLNRFQRSFLVLKGSTKIKDSTQDLSKFLQEVFIAVCEFLRVSAGDTTELTAKKQVLRLVMHHMQRTFAFAIAPVFDDAAFQSHMALGTSLAQTFSVSEVDYIRSFAETFNARMTANFASGFNLTTGLWMEEVWRVLRPVPLANEVLVNQTAAITKLAARFDALRWKAKAPIQDLSKAVATLCTAYGLIRRNCNGSEMNLDTLIEALKKEIDTLDASIGVAVTELPPFFRGDFEALRQLLVLDAVSLHPVDRAAAFSALADIFTLASTPTMNALLLGDGPSGTGVSSLQLADFLVCQGLQDKLVRSSFIPNIISHINAMENTNLNALSLLETELPILGRYLAVDTSAVTVDPVVPLMKLLGDLTEQVLGTIIKNPIEIIKAVVPPFGIPELVNVNSWVGSTSTMFETESFANVPAHVASILKSDIAASLSARAAALVPSPQQTLFAGIAWVQFALGTLKLYVPDRAFDPQLRSALEIEAYNQLMESLQERLGRLMAFQEAFTGQKNSEEITSLEKEIASYGAPPEKDVAVYRPVRSELSAIQTEFGNIVKSILRSDAMVSFIETLSKSTSAADIKTSFALLNGNISHVIDRIAYRFEAYQDMIRPATNLLRCLQLGLSLCASAFSEVEASNAVKAGSHIGLFESTPFLGSGPESPLPGYKGSAFEFLDCVMLSASVEDIDSLAPVDRDSLFQCFHSLFDEWKKKLETDKKEEQANQSIFHFKGSYEDEVERDEEEFVELFPTFDEEEQRDDDGNLIYIKKEEKKPKTSLSNRMKVRDMSIRVADVHCQLFLSLPEPSVAIRKLLTTVGRKAAHELTKGALWETDDSGKRSPVATRLLPAALISLHDSLSDIMSTDTSAEYNFYTMPNLQQARAIVSLTDRVKARFRALQLVDEIGYMAPLKEVILRCNKLLELPYSAPLAQLLPRVEALHAAVYEWQFGGWASRIHTAPVLYEELTITIVKWRSLELTTWARLLDMEVSRAVENARAWWFVAYQAVIANPAALLAGTDEEREHYIVTLVSDLQMYFSSAPIGEFFARLELLRALGKHLALMAETFPVLTDVHRALENFLAMQKCFSNSIAETIARGRAPIEKQMKMDVKLASWKDTNISALRESARKNHQKLFKHVRKFREVLAQPLEPVIERGIPEKKTAVSVFTTPVIGVAEIAPIGADISADIQNFLRDHRRLVNAPKTISLMAKAATLPESALKTATTLNEWLNSLVAAATELRKETPEYLTEENKDVVKHLKQRKRKLFADTLTDLKTMGLRYHHGTDALLAQSSVSLILATANSLVEEAEGADFYWHKLVDLLPKVRKTPNDHHAELSGQEVTRCVGFLEGILSVALSQRSALVVAGKKLLPLEARVERVKNLAVTIAAEAVLPVPADAVQKRSLKWLLETIRFAIELVSVHAKLGGCDNKIPSEKLASWLKVFDGLSDRADKITTLPEGFTSSAGLAISSKLSENSVKFTTEIYELIAQRKDLAFVLTQLLNWTGLVVNVKPTEPVESINLLDFATEVSTLVDKTLVAVEAYKRASGVLPASDEDQDWFITSQKVTVSMFSTLRPDELNAGIRKLTEKLASLPGTTDDQVRANIAGLLRLSVPIFNQYAMIVRATYERILEIHSITTYMGWTLGKTYVHLAKQGFCTPQEKSDEKGEAGAEGKLEEGTGLGEDQGGVEDISKDIEPDEDLSDLAQQPNEKKNDEEIEDSKDAVDMGGEDLEGEDGSAAGDEEDKEGENSDEEDDIDEEIGDVDDLDPTAVDEKMWDGEGEDEADKDQVSDSAKGDKKDDQQAAEGKNEEAQDPKNDDTADGDNDGQADENNENEEDEAGEAQDEAIRQDQNVDETEVLGTDDMELDLEDMDGEDTEEGLEDELGNMEMDAEENQEVEGEEEKTDEHNDRMEEEEKQDEDAADNINEANENPDKTEEPEDDAEVDIPTGEPVDLENEDPTAKEEAARPEEEKDNKKPDDFKNADENIAPSDVQSGGQDQNAEDSMDIDNAIAGAKDKQEDGGKGAEVDAKDAEAGTQGATSRPEENADKPDEAQKEEDTQANAKSEPFRKLGDALEQWHRQKREIKEADASKETPYEKEAQDKHDESAQEMKQQEFQHLQDEVAVPDTQAIGAASEEEVVPIDDAMAIDDDAEGFGPKPAPIDDAAVDETPEKPDTTEKGSDTDKEMADTEQHEDKNDLETRLGVKTRTGTYNSEPSPEPEMDLVNEDLPDAESETGIAETSTQLSATHLKDNLLPFDGCLSAWDEYTTSTFPLSQALTAQLRLILSPSQSTKLSGAFRTGKRLAIKRIIPYIASSYKRDKIWLRRTVPTKRAYQILIAVDDSRSMGESGSGKLALQSLVMTTCALSALEVGQIGVLGFGADVVTAHDLTQPFSSADAGAQALQHFRFEQEKTDIRLLIRKTIDTFKTARLQAPGSAGQDLWQLALILSDGITPSSEHDAIRRLLREAVEERIMVVFIVMDDAKARGGKGSSVLDLKFSSFMKDEDGNPQVVMGRYLDTFPFQYYLIVHNLEDLPGALAGLLRTWFAEVAT